MAELFPGDHIKIDQGEPGTMETTFIEHGIPAITAELGEPRGYQQDMIDRGLQGARNILIHYKVIDGRVGQTAKSRKAFIGNEMRSIRASTGTDAVREPRVLLVRILTTESCENV